MKKDKFRFGTFGSIDASQIMSKKVEELLLQEQLDNKLNFDHLVSDDPH